MTNPAPECAEPVRMCVICRQRQPKRELQRYTLGPDGNLTFDAAKTSPGRGWYVCRQEACLAKFVKFRPKPRH